MTKPAPETAGNALLLGLVADVAVLRVTLTTLIQAADPALQARLQHALDAFAAHREKSRRRAPPPR